MKTKAEKNEKDARTAKRSALAERDRADANYKEAQKNLIKAIEARKLSDANGLLYEAQGLVKYDPTLALHLVDTALTIVKSVKYLAIDPIIFDKANRIYYENNFNKTLFQKANNDTSGKITSATYAKDDRFVWTITDSAFAILLNREGELKKKVKLGRYYEHYTFTSSDDSQILVHGYNRSSTSYGTVWDIANGNPLVLLDSINVNPLNVGQDSVALALRDTSKGWAKRLFVFGYKVFQLKKDGTLEPVINGVRREVQLLAFPLMENM